MTPIEKLRSIADTTALDGVADAIREVADELERGLCPDPRHQVIGECIDRLEQGFGANSAPVVILRQHFGVE